MCIRDRCYSPRVLIANCTIRGRERENVPFVDNSIYLRLSLNVTLKWKNASSEKRKLDTVARNSEQKKLSNVRNSRTNYLLNSRIIKF